jgi:hypothetical protein
MALWYLLMRCNDTRPEHEKTDRVKCTGSVVNFLQVDHPTRGMPQTHYSLGTFTLAVGDPALLPCSTRLSLNPFRP